jgi:hypothetical protein
MMMMMMTTTTMLVLLAGIAKKPLKPKRRLMMMWIWNTFDREGMLMLALHLAVELGGGAWRGCRNNSLDRSLYLPPDSSIVGV